MKHIKTVTIGIPAHNEQANIGNLLKSILMQKGDNFQIESIVVLCDGCTDYTAAIAKYIATSQNHIKVVELNHRLGKMEALNKIYAMNKSEILVNLDADLVLSEKRALQKLVNAFDDPKIVLAAFHQIPVESPSFMGKICRASDLFWTESRMYVNGGDHVHNLLGSATAMRKIVSDRVRYPADLKTDAEYLYIKGKELGGFKYVYNAVALYRAPDTLWDFWSLSSRAIFYRRKSVAKYAHEDIDKIYAIPLRYKIKGMEHVFIDDPLYLVLAALFNIIVRIFPKKNKEVKSKKWEMAQSARKAIAI